MLLIVRVFCLIKSLSENKSVIIMNIKIKSSPENLHTELKCFVNSHNEITISIIDNIFDEKPVQSISIDASSAIHLSKVLRTNIRLIKMPFTKKERNVSVTSLKSIKKRKEGYNG